MLSYISGKFRGRMKIMLPAPEKKLLRNCTTYGLGGAAQIYYPTSICQAVKLYQTLSSSEGVPLILGNGSDVLASDGGVSSPVICTKRMSGIVRLSAQKILCLAGTTTFQLLDYCKRNGLGGLEYLAGIPATVGGLAYMNGGAGGKYISDNILAVNIYSSKLVTLDNKRCNFTYKHSTMRDIDNIILSIVLKVYPSSTEEVSGRVLCYLHRRASLPRGRSCGCVFKNPQGDYAARLIEQAGLKGKRLGGALVSPVHANFIINDGATSHDVRLLITEVKRTVFKTFGVLLEEEVVYFGD